MWRCYVKIGHTSRGVRGIFFRGGKVIFPDFFPDVKRFFPVENSHFLVVLKSEKQKKKKKKMSLIL